VGPGEDPIASWPPGAKQATALAVLLLAGCAGGRRAARTPRALPVREAVSTPGPRAEVDLVEATASRLLRASGRTGPPPSALLLGGGDADLLRLGPARLGVTRPMLLLTGNADGLAAAMAQALEPGAAGDAATLRLLARAGYDLQEAVRLWENLARLEAEEPPAFLRRHPGAAARAERLARLVPKVLEEARAP
jgi:hypothetical protein